MLENIIENLRKTFNPTDEDIYKSYLDTFRKHYIPERFNQVELLYELNNPDIDHYISISNRTDGKSFNYIHALLNIAIEYNVGLSFYSRNMMLRTSYQTLLDEIIEVSPLFERQDFTFIRTQYYIEVLYNKKSIAIISSLNDATELKYSSNFLKKYPIMIYDEFLALETDYLPDEWERLKTIYESIDRNQEIPLIQKPKIIYLGNAVNFDSPVLHGLKIFNILEKHPINTAKIYKYDFNIMLEINRNDNANKQRNTRAFGSDNDAMTTAQFETNDHNIATENDRNRVRKNPRVIYVKLKTDYLKIWYNPDHLNQQDQGIILSIESRIQVSHDDSFKLSYQYNLQLKDNRSDSIYLNEKYFDENHLKKIDRGYYLFDNNFSKNMITGDFYELNMLKINKLIREDLRDDNLDKEIENKERQFKENYIEQTKRGLMAKMWE